MNEQELTERLVETLRAEASTVTSPPDAWAEFSQGNVTAIRPPSRRRVWLAAPVAVVGIAAVVVLAVIVQSPHDRTTTHVAANGSTTTALGGSANQPSTGPTAPALPVLVGPVGGPVPRAFAPTSVTFVSSMNGWLLGSAPCASPPCTSIVRTTDGGSTWAGIPAPRTSNVTTLRFANRLDGWAFGSSELWSTHDGGATWHRDPPVGVPTTATVEDVEAAAGLVRVTVTDDNGHVRIETSPLGHDAWQLDPALIEVGGGPVPTGQLVLHGTAGWFIEVDRTVVGGVRLVNGHWVAWAPPCLTAGGPALLTASSSTELVAVCNVGIWTGNATGEHVWVSHDGGTTFAETRTPIPSAGGVTAVASPRPGVVMVGDGSGALLATFDGGATWSSVAHEPSVGGYTELGFTTPSQGVAVVGQKFLMSHDGGRTWSLVPIV